jgi:hypothetical protein
MELTTSHERVMPDDVRARYDFAETRNAGAVLASTDPDAFAEVLVVLAGQLHQARWLLGPHHGFIVWLSVRRR